MGLARTRSVALCGVEGHLVEVEADLAEGLPGMTLTGLPDPAVAESRDRIRAAVVNSGETWPLRRITLALLPATLPKHGSGFDLPLAMALLCAAGAVPAEPVADSVLIGELGLDGRVRPVRGVLAAVLAAAREGVRRAVVPAANAREAALVPGVEVLGVAALSDLLARLRGEPGAPVGQAAGRAPAPPAPPAARDTAGPDLSEVAGQAFGRRVLEVAAAGGHHVLFVGPPGAGKTMLAERLPGVLPPLGDEDALDVTAVHSVAGTLPADAPLIRRPPFQDPHHTATLPALVGGGSGLPRPGAVSLAHRGVLFLDESPEFASGVLDALRQPLERGSVLVSRSRATVRFPARFQLVLAANPCPCARSGDAACACTPATRRRYLGRLSGPLLDRVDLQVWLAPVSRADLLCDLPAAESSAVVAARVERARGAAAERWSGRWRSNAEVPGVQLRSSWRLPPEVTRAAERALDRGMLSARGFDRVLRIAWSIADLAGRSTPDADDVAEAVGMRTRRGAGG